jgi:hypothetical protein
MKILQGCEKRIWERDLLVYQDTTLGNMAVIGVVYS